MKTRCFFALLSGVSLTFLTACKDNSEGPSQESFTLIDKQQIGASGGSVGSAEYMTVDIPAGAFVTSVDLEMYSSDGENPFKEDGASGLVYLKGLPAQFIKPIRIALKHDGTATDGTYINQAQLTANTSTFDTIYGTNLIQANDSAGFLVAFLPVPQPKGRNADENSGIIGNDNGVQYSCVKGLTKRQSDHFIIYHRNTDVYDPGLEALNDGLEAGYQLLAEAYFEVNRLTKPVNVYLKYLNDEIYGQTNRDFPFYTDNSGYIEINRLHLMEPALMKITGAHEFFHIVQDLYNFDDKYNWLQEASSTWFEKFFTSSPGSYVPQTFTENLKQPFWGLQMGVVKGADKHGYGTSSVIKYLVENGNNAEQLANLRKIWDLTKTGKHPVQALIEYQSNYTPNWWNEFIKAYFTNQVYGGVTEAYNKYWFNQNPTDVFRVRGANDKEIIFNNDGKDLSGYVYLVNIDWDGLTNLSKCTISLSSGISRLYVFKKKDTEIELLSEVYMDEEITVSDLKSFYDNGYDICLLLSNFGIHALENFTGYYPTQIHVQISDEEEDNSVTYYETQADNYHPYFSGSFLITFETDDDYPFTVTKDQYFISEGVKVKDLYIHFDPPPAGVVVTFNITIDTLSLSCVNPGKIEINKAIWAVSDMTLIPYVYPQPDILPYHVTAQYSSSNSAGPCSFWLELLINEPYFSNNLDVMMLGFNIGKDH